jgi:hypothetical protein
VSVDLSLVPTDDLLEALKDRFDHMLFGGMRIAGGERADEHLEFWSGHVLWCQGMATDIIRTVQDWAREHNLSEDADDEPLPGGHEA